MNHAYRNHNVAYHAWIQTHILPGARILDVGCGDGLLLSKLAPSASRAVGIEPAPTAADEARRRLSAYENATVYGIPFDALTEPDGTYDVIIFVASLHHMDLQAALLRAKALLSDGGCLLVVRSTAGTSVCRRARPNCPTATSDTSCVRIFPVP